MENLSQSIEDYLESLLKLESSNGVRITDLANFMEVSKASANDAVGRLKKLNYVSQERYGNIFITESGKKIAEKIMEKHNVLTRFLHEHLKVSKKNAELDACQIEHIISDETYKKIKKILK